MKKILYSLFFTFIFTNLIYAQDSIEQINQTLGTNIQLTPEMIEQTNKVLGANIMPSDEVIMQTIQRFNFPPEQTRQLFEDTKKELQKMYQSGNIENHLNQTYNP